MPHASGDNGNIPRLDYYSNARLAAEGQARGATDDSQCLVDGGVVVVVGERPIPPDAFPPVLPKTKPPTLREGRRMQGAHPYTLGVAVRCCSGCGHRP